MQKAISNVNSNGLYTSIHFQIDSELIISSQLHNFGPPIALKLWLFDKSFYMKEWVRHSDVNSDAYQVFF